jgi:hypothetical protein
MMEARGRRSAASLAVVSSNELEAFQRPCAPDGLSPEQASEWVQIVNRLPADWISRETEPLLAQYCRHIVAARRVADLIKSAEADEECSIKDYDRLLKMQEREGRALTSLATKMRISQQSTYDKSKKKPGAGRKPWEG